MSSLCECHCGLARPKTINPTYEIRRRQGRRRSKKRRKNQSFRSAGTLPPFAASLFMTWRCSQMFMVAESFVSPV